MTRPSYKLLFSTEDVNLTINLLENCHQEGQTIRDNKITGFQHENMHPMIWYTLKLPGTSSVNLVDLLFTKFVCASEVNKSQ